MSPKPDHPEGITTSFSISQQTGVTEDPTAMIAVVKKAKAKLKKASKSKGDKNE